MLGWIVVIFAVLVGVFYLLTGETSTLSDLGTWERWGLIGGAVLMSFYILALLSGYGGRIADGLKHAGIWLGIFVLLIAGYSFRDEVSFVTTRIVGELSPPGSIVSIEENAEGSAVRIRRRLNGHFVARSVVNGTTINMLVDTGASTVVLKPADAQRAGIDTGSLEFTIPVRTANGTAFAAPVRLRSVEVGPIRYGDVEALVAKPGSLNESLLGMSFLRRLRSYEFTADFLTLRS